MALHGNGAAAASVSNVSPVTLTAVAPTLSDIAGGYLVSAIVIAGGGTAYTANDVLTVGGGTSTTTAQITVDTVDGSGVILTAHVSRGGDYSVKPTDPVSVTGGTGTGATFNLTWSDLGATYYVRVTYNFSFGEQPASAESNRVVAGGRKLRVASPAATLFATGYYVYVSTTTGTETLQAGPIAIGTNWTIPITGLAAGAALPTTIQIDGSVSEDWIATLTANTTLANPLNLAAGHEFNLWLSQDATGSRVLTYDTQWQAAGGVSTIALSTTASAKDLVSGVADSATTITTRIQKAIAH